jgi:hypothetical protein
MTKFRNKQIFGSRVTPYHVELFHFQTKPFILGSKIFAIISNEVNPGFKKGKNE